MSKDAIRAYHVSKFVANAQKADISENSENSHILDISPDDQDLHRRMNSSESEALQNEHLVISEVERSSDLMMKSVARDSIVLAPVEASENDDSTVEKANEIGEMSTERRDSLSAQVNGLPEVGESDMGSQNDRESMLVDPIMPDLVSVEPKGDVEEVKVDEKYDANINVESKVEKEVSNGSVAATTDGDDVSARIWNSWVEARASRGLKRMPTFRDALEVCEAKLSKVSLVDTAVIADSPTLDASKQPLFGPNDTVNYGPIDANAKVDPTDGVKNGCVVRESNALDGPLMDEMGVGSGLLCANLPECQSNYVCSVESKTDVTLPKSNAVIGCSEDDWTNEKQA